MEMNRNDEAVALERYKIISPILTAMEENAAKGKIGFLKNEACGLAGVSRKTLKRWLVFYTQPCLFLMDMNSSGYYFNPELCCGYSWEQTPKI